MIHEIKNLVSDCYPEIIHDKHITNRLFVFIEKNQNQKISNQYFCLCQTYGTKTINRLIGRLLKTIYHLPNTGHAIATSKFIKTYTLH